MRSKVTLRNDFHNTCCTLFAERGGNYTHLSARQIVKSRKALCGVAGCVCGGFAGERGPQFMLNEYSNPIRCYLEANDDGSADLFPIISRETYNA